MIILAPNWRSFVSLENRIVWTHYKWPSDILTTKTEPWNRTVERLLPIFGTKNRILKIGSCERVFRQNTVNPNVVPKGRKILMKIRHEEILHVISCRLFKWPLSWQADTIFNDYYTTKWLYISAFQKHLSWAIWPNISSLISVWKCEAFLGTHCTLSEYWNLRNTSKYGRLGWAINFCQQPTNTGCPNKSDRVSNWNSYWNIWPRKSV